MEAAPVETVAIDGNVVQLFAMSAAMFVGAFAAGYFPLLFSLSAERLRIITLLGAGLLIGTALVVIIPEGMHMWLAASSSSDPDEHNEHGHHDGTEHSSEAEHDGGHAHDHGHEHHEHWQIGASMAAGFAFMLLIDKLSGGHHGHAHGGNNSKELPSTTTATTTAHSSDNGSGSTASAFIGLVIHAAVDGVAVGASCFSSGMESSMLIFVAIMLHKAPAAFGLTAYLNQAGEKARDVRRQLLLFSLAAPVGAVVTFYAMGMGVVSYQMSTLAIVMLFSGGTFLFVATMHILPEVLTQQELSWAQAALLVAGILFPIIINIEHGH
eukprot:TRINITY_DN8996_c0_g2_i1.p1 TRINITY_DN8996_c0_g2~~TRINITY_DN8996_c0_g2_i1.p1  ORF type:complete len:324 (+),score=57.75 TRINITY_DN8996_c0_g2_i1:115-1086(+)